MRPEEHLAKRLFKIFCLRLVSWEQRIITLTRFEVLEIACKHHCIGGRRPVTCVYLDLRLVQNRTELPVACRIRSIKSTCSYALLVAY